MSPGPKILVADDHDVNRRLIERILAPHGYAVLHASNGRQAVDMAIEHIPALVLMDVRMPVMDGKDALQALRNDARTAHIPVIAVTAFATKAQLQPIIEAGFDAVVTKPIDVDTLLELVRTRVPVSR